MNKDIVIVSGGANGLGLSLTKKLIDKDYYVCIIDQDEEASNQLKILILIRFMFIMVIYQMKNLLPM